MAEEKKEKWLNYLALSTVLIAVCATLSTFKGGGYGSKALMHQTSAANQWSYYQSKSIKSYIFENQKDNLELQRDLLTESPRSAEVSAEYQTKIDNYASKLKQYEADKADIKAKAEAFEKERDVCQAHSSAFGIAVIFLQIAILLSSVAALIKKKILWILSMGVGVVGVIYFLNGFMLFM